jgi:hypothetical protein
MAQQPAETDLRGGAVGGVGLRGKRKEKTSGGEKNRGHAGLRWVTRVWDSYSIPRV